jgi:hypothetical protein
VAAWGDATSSDEGSARDEAAPAPIVLGAAPGFLQAEAPQASGRGGDAAVAETQRLFDHTVRIFLDSGYVVNGFK